MVLPPIPMPDTLKGVDDLIRSGFEAYRESCFNWLLVATGLVVVGLLFEAFELVPDIVLIIRRKLRERRLGIKLLNADIPEWAKTLAFVGWFLIVAGVGGEFVADSFVSKADGFVQKFDEILLAETTTNAGDARLNALSAATAARLARQQSDQAVSSASDASAVAHGARREADSFEQDIRSAKKQAAEAESHLNEALQRAAEATAELKRLASDRSLVSTSELKAKLEPFKGIQYEFANVYPDEESIHFLIEIDDLLQSAGWKPVRVAEGDLHLILTLPNGTKFNVAPGTSRGIRISVSSPVPDSSLRIMPESSWPRHVWAGGVLNMELQKNTFPPPIPADVRPLFVHSPGSPTQLVEIEIGRK
jgi:hypothetical protein